MQTLASTLSRQAWTRTVGALVAVALVIAIGSAAFADNEEAAGAGAVLAQGYAFLPEEPFVWRARSVEPLPADEAEPISPGFSFAYQRNGALLVRNESTAKRTRLEPGEAYYFQQGDSFTRHRDGSDDPETLIIEWVSAENAGAVPSGTLLFESDVLDPSTAEVVDYELTRYVLHSGEALPLPDRDGPSLGFVLAGFVSFSTPAGLYDLDAENGMLVPADATEVIAGPDGGVVLVASIIDHALRATPETSPVASPAAEMSDAEPTEEPTATAVPPTATPVPPTATPKPPTATPRPAATATPRATATTGSTLAPAADEDRDGLRNGEESQLGTNPRVKDTDSDGLEDGPEVNLHGTDPLKPDTDGDGITDGQEVNVDKTNPLDKASKK